MEPGAMSATDDDQVLSILLSGERERISDCIHDRGPNFIIEGKTILHWLALVGDVDALSSALKMRGDPNIKAASGEAALMSAAYSGDRRIAELLINAGADVDAQDADGQTALMAAAKGGNLPTVQLLIQAAANVALVDSQGRSALH